VAKGDTSLEEKMTPKERSVFEEWKSRIGKEIASHPIEETLAQLNDQLDPGPYFFGWNEEASESAIKRFAVATQDFDALWFDEEYAKKSRWGGRIAPPLFLMCINDGLEPNMAFTRYINDSRHRPPSKYTEYQAGHEWEFFEPMRPGDKIEVKSKLIDLYWKQGREYRLLFCQGETTYTNQNGKLVARCIGSDVHLFR
jgi:acyl dehydratase